MNGKTNISWNRANNSIIKPVRGYGLILDGVYETSTLDVSLILN